MLPMLFEMMRYSEEHFPGDDEAPNRLRHLEREKHTAWAHCSTSAPLNTRTCARSRTHKLETETVETKEL